MDFRIIIICIVTAYGQTPEYYPQHKSNGDVSIISGAQKSQFNKSSLLDKESLKLDSTEEPISQSQHYFKKSLSGENNLNKMGFSQPLQFISSKDEQQDFSFNDYKTPTESYFWNQDTKSEEKENIDETTYLKRTKPITYKQPKRPIKARGASTYEKSSDVKKPYKLLHKYSGLRILDQPKDVEMILPHDKVIYLPMVNGKPKPYDGYRVAPEEETYYNFDKAKKKETEEQRERRLNHGEIIYGKHKIAQSPSFPRHFKRSPAQYYGGIYPYYDYSDSKLHRGRFSGPKKNKRKTSDTIKKKKNIAYPKKQYFTISGNSYNPYKFSKDNSNQRREDNEDSQESQSKESSKEVEADSEEVSKEKENESEETESTDYQQPLYKYALDNTFHIPQLNIKFYPYEKKLKDSNVEGSRRKELYKADDSDDEFTEGYERYVKSLPSDLESYFGKPDSSDRFTVEETQNLENNKNCKKVEPASNEKEEKPESEKNNQNQVCYICIDEKTGDSYEQCAYQTTPVSKKFFFGGSKSYKTNDTSEPTTYRYRRSPLPYKPKVSLSELSESAEANIKNSFKFSDFDYDSKPKKNTKKKYKKRKKGSNIDFLEIKNRKKERQKRGEYESVFGVQGASSTKRGRAAALDQPPKSYDGPQYTYAGPAFTYEGPANPYEGPKETYEGPINQEYYDTTDERIADDEEESQNQEYHSSLPTDSNYYNEKNFKNQRKQNFYPYYKRLPYEQHKHENDEYQEGTGFKPAEYSSDYRFGPEHFIEEDEQEDSKKNFKGSEKKGPHKFPPQEMNAAAATDAKEKKEEILGESKVFKNGDKCIKKRKDGMICMECKNEKTGATYEQCQYSTKPKEKFYAFGTQKSYSAKKPTTPRKIEPFTSDLFPETSDVVEKKILIKTHNKVFGSDIIPSESLVPAESNTSPQIQPSDLLEQSSGQVETSTEQVEEHKQNDTSNTDITESGERIEPRDGIEGLEEYLYGAEDGEKKHSEEEKQSFKSYDDYFYDLFPDFAKSSEAVPESDEKEESESERHLTFDPFSNIRQFHEENARNYKENLKGEEEEEENEKDAEASRPEEIRLKDKKSRIPSDFFTPYSEDHKKDLEAALGEFQKKDWSNCKKIVKKKLTCYQCVDKNGVNNEECMYVEASQPISTHLSYHERKDLQPLRIKEINNTTETANEGSGMEKEKSLKRFRKAKNSQADLIEAEKPVDVEYLVNHTAKGDFEGIKNLETKDSIKSSKSEYVEPLLLNSGQNKKESKHKKQGWKTPEIVTEALKVVQKTDFSSKKANVSHQPKFQPPETKSFGSKFPTKSILVEKIASQN